MFYRNMYRRLPFVRPNPKAALGPWLATGLAVLISSHQAFLPARASAQEVTLSLEDYDTLREMAQPQPARSTTPAAPISLEEAQLEIVVGPHAARLEQRLVVNLLTDEWHVVHLPDSNRFTEVDFGSLEGRVRADDGALVIRGSSRHEIVVHSALPLVEEESRTRRSFEVGVPTPSAGVVRGRVHHAESLSRAEVIAGGAVLSRTGSGDFDFVAVPGETLQLAFEETAPGADSSRPRIETQVVSRSTIRRTRFLLEARIEVDLLSGSLDTLRVDLPPGFTLLEVRGATLDGWDVQNGTLVCTLLGATDHDFRLELLLSAEPRERFSSPILRPRGAERVLHYTRTRVEGDGLLTLLDQASSRRVDTSERELLDQVLRHNATDGQRTDEELSAIFAIVDPDHPPSWEVTWSEGVEMLVARVDRLLLDVIVGRQGWAAYQLLLEVDNRGLQWLELELPEGFVLESATRFGNAVQLGKLGERSALPLSASAATETFMLRGLVPFIDPTAVDSFELEIPHFSAPVNRVETRLQLPDSATYAVTDESHRGQVEHGSTRLPETPATTELQAGWDALSPSPAPLRVDVQPKRSQARWF